jgi:hypothetical protein
LALSFLSVLDEEAKVPQLALGLAGKLTTQHRSSVCVLVDARWLFRERFLPGLVQGEQADGETDDERDPGRRPRA